MNTDIMLQCIYCGITSDEDYRQWRKLSDGLGICWECGELEIEKDLLELEELKEEE